MRAPFDNGLALRLAAACQLAYDQRAGPLVPPPGYAVSASFTAEVIDRPEPIGFLMTSANDSVIAFRGTDSFLDWLADAHYAQTAFPFAAAAVQAHKGFTEVYQSCRQQVVAAVNAAPAALPLYVTGHSLGGGLATLAALDIAANTTFADPVVYTIASPRVGDPSFAGRFNALVATCWRVLNTLDLVPLLPPEDIFDGLQLLHYQHVDEWDPITFLGGGVAGNHALANYVKKLKAGLRA
jgi:triacylglycerol lipase